MTKQISVIQFQIGSDCFMRLILLSLIFVDEILSISWLRTPHSALLVQKLSTHDSIGNRFKSFSNFGVYEYNRLSYLSALIVEYDYPDIKYPIPGIYPNSPISSIEFLNCNNSRDNYAMCSVQQEHQRGAHSMIRDRTYRPVLVSYIIPRVIRNSLISRVRPSLMLLLNTTHRVVAIRIGVLEKRGD